MSTSPTRLTLQHLRAVGYTVAVVERWNPHARLRQDLWGWCDLLAYRGDRPGVLGVQTTSDSHLANRLKKMLGVRSLREYLVAGNSAEVHGWKKVAGKWRVRKRVILLEELS